MAYLEYKKIKGKLYKYERRSYRIGDKVKHTSKYLGPAEPVGTRKKGQGRKPEVFVRALSKDEISILQKAKKSGNSFTKDRATVLLLSSDHLSVLEIGKRTNKERRSVAYAIQEFNANGIKALQRGKAKGAAPKFSETTKKVILMHFSKQPKDFGLHFTTWTLPRFREYLMEDKVVDSISIERLRQILDEAGARLKRSKRWQYSPDPEFHKKKLQ